MKNRVYAGICMAVRTVTWTLILLAVLLASVPMLLLGILLEAVRGDE